jgi:hypothetical protein
MGDAYPVANKPDPEKNFALFSLGAKVLNPGVLECWSIGNDCLGGS